MPLNTNNLNNKLITELQAQHLITKRYIRNIYEAADKLKDPLDYFECWNLAKDVKDRNETYLHNWESQLHIKFPVMMIAIWQIPLETTMSLMAEKKIIKTIQPSQIDTLRQQNQVWDSVINRCNEIEDEMVRGITKNEYL